MSCDSISGSPRWTSLGLRWLLGAVVGTLLIAITSPLFIRSYLPLTASAQRGVWVLSPGQIYRWRSEGYADTEIGPLGMPGRASLPSREEQPDALRVALWGDSQAEGVSVADHLKLFASIERHSKADVIVFPFARSGEDAADWVTEMPRIENEIEIDAHVFLLVDLDDLLSATEAPLSPPSASDQAAANASLATHLPAFVIQAGRNLLTQPDGVTRRRLRFAIGPTPQADFAAEDQPTTLLSARPEQWAPALDAIDKVTDRPVLLVYAPKVPMIVRGQIIRKSDSSQEFEALRQAAESRGLIVVDTRDALLKSADRGVWPHGFHNGRFGSGHLNAEGNAILAEQIWRALSAIPDDSGLE